MQPPPALPDRAQHGPIVAIGGNEDKSGSRLVLAHLLELAGPNASVAVIASASRIPAERHSCYRQAFLSLGAAVVLDASPDGRPGGSGRSVAMLAVADLVFLTGGEQVRLMAAIDGPVAAAVLAAHRRGATVAGTSAGASALSTHMLTGRPVALAAGLGLLPGLVVDQHFTQRSRLARLTAAVEQVNADPARVGAPRTLAPVRGVGVDEDTAVTFAPDGTLHVTGSGLVSFVDWDDGTLPPTRRRPADRTGPGSYRRARTAGSSSNA